MAEEIPPEDAVSRLVDSPDKWDISEVDFIEVNLWRFTAPDNVESVVWRKYAATIGHVHQKGCELQKAKRPKKPSFTYEGAITTRVEEIRKIVTDQGDRFEVVHDPDEGIHHAHVHLQLAADRVEWKQRKTNLKEMLQLAFSPLEAHACPE